MNLTDSFLTRPKSYDNIDFAKAVFEILTSEICPHGLRKYMFCKKCYNREYKQRTKGMRNKELRDKYHEQHPDARYFKHHNP